MVLPQASPSQATLVSCLLIETRLTQAHNYISAHMNLLEEYLPYKYIIGQVILDVCILKALFISSLT